MHNNSTVLKHLRTDAQTHFRTYLKRFVARSAGRVELLLGHLHSGDVAEVRQVGGVDLDRFVVLGDRSLKVLRLVQLVALPVSL